MIMAGGTWIALRKLRSIQATPAMLTENCCLTRTVGLGKDKQKPFNHLLGLMNTLSSPPIPQSADKVFLALGQTLYACQLFEATMLEVIAHAHELLDGTGDGGQLQSSIEQLSRKTLGQVLHELRKRADIRSDIDSRLNEGLEARNFVVHHFASHVGDDLVDETKGIAHQRALYEKCVIIMTANDTALTLLDALAKLNTTKSAALASELEQTARDLRELAKQYSRLRH